MAAQEPFERLADASMGQLLPPVPAYDDEVEAVPIDEVGDRLRGIVGMHYVYRNVNVLADVAGVVGKALRQIVPLRCGGNFTLLVCLGVRRWSDHDEHVDIGVQVGGKSDGDSQGASCRR